MWTALLFGLGLVASEPSPKPPTPAAEAAPEQASHEEALAHYNARRADTPNTAAAQMKLAEWCDQNGLEAEAFVHYAAVVQLDPSRTTAWRKLGYKKRQGRWMTEAQITDEAEQAKATKEWAPRLKKIHKDIHRGPRRDEAVEAAAAIDDPRAVPAVYREFGAGGAADQLIAVQILGQLDSPLSSKVLALMAVYGKSPDVRRRATETLRRRDPEHYLALLVSLMADTVKYEVRPVGGPGSPGVLFIEGERANFRRVYAPPVPSVSYKPGDLIGYDANGSPVLIRPMATLISKPFSMPETGKPGSSVKVSNDLDSAVRFNLANMVIEAQRGAISAQQQLEGDVKQLDALNDAVKDFNERVMSVAKIASGEDHGNAPKDWRAALAAKGQYGSKPKKAPRKPTLDQLVPLAYQPRFGELTFINLVTATSGDS